MVQISQLSRITVARLLHDIHTNVTRLSQVQNIRTIVAQHLRNIYKTFDKFWPKFSWELTQHSSSICATYADVLLERERERNVLFNNALNTFYLRLYGVRHMVKDHSDSEKGNPLPLHRLLLSINSKVLLYAPSHRQDNTYHGLCYTSRGALAGKRNSSMGPPHEGSIRRPTAPGERSTSELRSAPMYC